MIDRIITFSAHNRVLVLALVAAAAVGGWWSMRHVPLDAIPDLGDTQVIVYSQWDRSPDLIESQVTYPIVTALLGAPKVRAVRGYSDFGYSYVYVIYEDGTDIYWARARTTEYLSSVLPHLPSGVQTNLGPDASAVGWVFQYVLVDESGRRSLAELRSFQDWSLRYYLKSVPGVAEVASVGGFETQYQVSVDPGRLLAYKLPIDRVVEAVRGGNSDTGGRLVELGGTEYMVRGLGYARGAQDLENIVLARGAGDGPIRIKDVGRVVIGPGLRRGATDLDGRGEAVSGIVVMRQGENALAVIDRVKERLRQIEPGLPAGLRVVPVYDRSELIRRSIETLRATLIEVILIVVLVILVFLWHVPSALIPVITIPAAVLISFIPFRMLGISANIMSLGGIAIAIGALVDAAIVVVEQVHKRLEEWQRRGGGTDDREIILAAVKEVGGPSFFALLVIAVSFLPVLTLEAQEGRLFKPLAYTKTLAMVLAAVLAITLDPALRMMFTRMRPFTFRPAWLRGPANALLVGTIHPEERHPISRRLIRLYEPVVAWSLRHKGWVIGSAIAMIALTIPVGLRLGSEFMPPLDEGSILYMPSTMPGISIGEAQRLLQVTDRIIAGFPEVEHVLGKAGRAGTPTDPAPLSMLETVIILKPHSEWPAIPTWYSEWAPGWMRPVLRKITPDRSTTEDLIARMNARLDLPGLSNAWTMPVKGRIDMLTTGMRTPVGLKIAGADLETIERTGAKAEAILRTVPGTRNVFSERTGGGSFLDVAWNREELARHNLGLERAQSAVQHAIGGEDVTTLIAGRERYAVNVRYNRDFRADLTALERVLVPTADDQSAIPLAALADVRVSHGPSMIRDEDGLLTGYVFVDIVDRDPAGYIADASRALAERLQLPPGYAVFWSGQYEAMQRVRERLLLVVPITLLLILLLLYLNTRSMVKTMIVALAVPFSAIGAIWFLYLLGYNLSVAVWIGMIALLGVDAETGVFMLLYLDLSYEQARREGRLRSREDLHAAILQGAARRIRPKFMTVATCFLGLVPIMWATGAGSDVMKRIAAPMIGGLLTSFLLELVVYPALYELWKWRFEVGPRLSEGAGHRQSV